MSKFKVGDKVRVRESADCWAAGEPLVKAGDILTVQKIWEGVPFPVYTNESTNQCWPDRDLELVE